MTYAQAVETFRKIAAGVTKSEVIGLLGEPQQKGERRWYYDFTILPGGPDPSVPPAVGAQVFYGGAVFFDKAGIVEDSRFAWLDVTGPAPQ